MTITDILTVERVIAELAADTKEGVLDETSKLIAPFCNGGVDPATVLSVLRERERLNSTAIGEGIAIPHGRLAGVKAVVAAFARSSRGIDFDSVDRQPTRMFFVIIAPDDAAAMHLKALARISRLLKDHDFRNHLLAVETREALFDAIVAEDAKLR